MCRGHCTTTKNVNNKIMLHKKNPEKKSTFTEPANYIYISQTKIPIRFGFMIINLNIYKLY